MEELGKKVGYLRALMDTVKFSGDPATEKLIRAMGDLICETADHVASVQDLMDDLNDYVESIDDDLAALENESRGGFLDEEDADGFPPEENSPRSKIRVFRKEDAQTGAPIPCLCPKCDRAFFVTTVAAQKFHCECPFCRKRVMPVELIPQVSAPVVEAEEN